MSNPTQNSSIEYPAWFDGKRINEGIFCTEFLRDYPMLSVNGTFFTVNGRVRDENRLKKVIYDRIKQYITSGVAKKVTNLLDVMRMECCTTKLPLYQDRIHVANGTYYLDGTFTTDKDFCRNRLPVAYNPDAPQPEKWLLFLSQLLVPEDIPTLQEFMGYCFLPSTKGQKMLLLTGRGGEGKSRIGVVLMKLLGHNMNTGSIAKVETSPFARADLEHELLMLDDDLKLEALPQTNNISEGYIQFCPDGRISSHDLYQVYQCWCTDNELAGLPSRSFCSWLKQNEARYRIQYTNKVAIGGGRFARGFNGIQLLQRQNP